MSSQIHRLTFLLAIAGLLTISADFACLSDYDCPSERAAGYHSLEDIQAQRIETLDEALTRRGTFLSVERKAALSRDGHVLGALAPLDRPLRHPDGTVEMPEGWLPDLPAGHPWAARLTPSDDAFYSWFEERILDAKLYDPASPQHVAFAEAYLAKQSSASPHFQAWTFASTTECPKKKSMQPAK